jgi:RNA polymerase sigma-70 factor, ECF subfamily
MRRENDGASNGAEHGERARRADDGRGVLRERGEGGLLRAGSEERLLRGRKPGGGGREAAAAAEDVRVPLTTEGAWVGMRQKLHAFVARRVPSRADADDILQHVFLQLHRQAAGPENVGAWLHQAARNAVSDFYRKPSTRLEQAAGSALDLDLLGGRFSSDEGEADRARQAAAACLLPMIGRLPMAYGNALRLTGVYGMSQARAAAREAVSVSGMKSRVQRGRRLLKQLVLEACRMEMDGRGAVMACRPRGRGCGRPRLGVDAWGKGE